MLAGNNIDNKKERKRLEQEAATMVVMARRSSNGAASDCYRCRQRGWEGQRWQREIAMIEAGSERGPRWHEVLQPEIKARFMKEGSSSEALEMKRRRRWGVRQAVVAVVVTVGGEEEIRTTLMWRLVVVAEEVMTKGWGYAEEGVAGSDIGDIGQRR
ncbi:hypothetical protein B296_00005535 [Ensete ventricosum]|uniref:Uncharacterized protein n=1 Tax=Ensete ventricosum TaxID=4639 RepID=A0A427ALN2_ENSVE|nr:hypothetical protein B296_00005535 [Ensete ventricosum]